MLSYQYWVTRFGADRNVLGQKIVVNDYPMTVVGVSAAGFNGLDPSARPADSYPNPDEARDDPWLGRLGQ